MAREGLCRLNSEGVAAVRARYRQGRWANVAAFCNTIGIPRSTYYEVIARDKWFEMPTLQDKLTAMGIPTEDQAGLCEFREFGVDPPPTKQTCPNNLPLQPTSFIGREMEKATLKQLLASTNLLTLTGSGGCGKTRLAVQVGAELLDAYPDGVWITELASLTEPNLVGPTLLAALGLREEPRRSPMETAVVSLKPKKVLLILDNCEHLVGACAHLATVLICACPQVKILATSRESLGISGETVWRVPSLPTADPSVLKTEKDLSSLIMDFDACRLFVERARGHRQDLDLSRSSAVSVARICERLDGIPLAIELAAACVRFLSVGEIEARLGHRFRLLTGGSRTVLPRHQTLRALIDWSWDLLDAQEKLLLARLSVFAGGWTLESAEAVCCTQKSVRGWALGVHNPSHIVDEEEDSEAIKGERIAPNAQRLTLNAFDVLDLHSGLVDKSLVIADTKSETTRYRLLQTVRQYAYDRLAESNESLAVRGRHLDYFLQLAQEARPKLAGLEQAHWLSVLEAEHDNLSQASTFSLEEPEAGAKGLHLGAALQGFWEIRGHLGEGRELLDVLLTLPEARERSDARADALNGAGVLAEMQGDTAAAYNRYEECLTIWRELGDKQGIAASLANLANVAHERGDYATVRSLQEESLAIRQELGDKRGLAASLNGLANVAWHQGDHTTMRSLQEQSLAIRRELGDQHGIALLLGNMGALACDRGDYASGRSLLEESLAIRQELGDRPGIAHSLVNLGNVAHDQRDYASARSLCEESLALYRELGNRRGVAEALQALGAVACDQGDYVWARSLYEEALAIHRELGNKRSIASALNGLGSVVFRQGVYALARSLQEESLRIYRDLGDGRSIAQLLEWFASLAMTEKTSECAARLWGAASALREQIGLPRPPKEREADARIVAEAREALSEEAFSAAWEEGRVMTLDQAATYALESTSP